MGVEVAVREEHQVAPVTNGAGLLRPVATPAELLQVQQETRQLVVKTLKEGRDYGLIPGTNKPTLWKPGAEQIALAFNCRPEYKIIEGEHDHDRPVTWVKRSKQWKGPKGARTFEWVEERGESQGLYRYVIECSLYRRDTNQLVAAAAGSCSTMESKYVDRPRDCENTVLKMASKRALVAVVLNAFGLSDQFRHEEDEEQPDADEDGPGYEVATPEQRARLQQLVTDLVNVKALKPAQQKIIRIAGELANSEQAPAAHVEEAIAKLGQMKETAIPSPAPAEEELPFNA